MGHLGRFTRELFALRLSRKTNPKYSNPRLRDLVTKEAALLKKYVRDGALVLDAGCGDGRNAFRVVDDLAVRPSRIVMLDINPQHLKRVQQNIQADAVMASLFEPVLGNIFNIAYPEGTFDVIIALGDVLSLASGGSIEDGLRELRRVTKPGGLLIFSLVTKECLLRVARERNLPDKMREIEATGIYTDWNHQCGEGVFRSWGESLQIENKVRPLGMELLEMEQVYIDYRDIPARLLLTCRKV